MVGLLKKMQQIKSLLSFLRNAIFVYEARRVVDIKFLNLGHIAGGISAFHVGNVFSREGSDAWLRARISRIAGIRSCIPSTTCQYPSIVPRGW